MEIHGWLVDSRHKGPVMWKALPCHDVIMFYGTCYINIQCGPWLLYPSYCKIHFYPYHSELLLWHGAIIILVRVLKCDSVRYMNSALRKAQYKRNMARNKFKKFGKQCREENRRTRNHVVKIRKQSMQKYFTEHCSKNDRNFWAIISPFFSDRRLRSGHNIYSAKTTMWKLIPVILPNDFI